MVHSAASQGYADGTDQYAAGRPDYRPEALEVLVRRLGTERWVEVGAGTGIATRALVERDVDVTAVEPVAEMRERLQQSLPQVPAEAGTSEAIPLADDSAAVVLAAQAFHWFDHGPALDEIVRVLDRDGALVTLWNVRDQSVPWVRAYTEISNRYEGETPRWHTMVWRRAIEADSRFELEFERSWPNPFPSSPDLVVARLLSTSYIAALDTEIQARLEADLRAVVDSLGASFDYPYDTEFQIWRRVA